MSEKLTRIRLRDRKFAGWMDWGEHSHAEMVAQIRNRARYQLEEAQAVLAARPEDFDVDVVRGSIVQRHIRKIEPA